MGGSAGEEGRERPDRLVAVQKADGDQAEEKDDQTTGDPAGSPSASRPGNIRISLSTVVPVWFYSCKEYRRCAKYATLPFMAKKKNKKTKTTRKTAKVRKPVPVLAAPKRPRGRPPKPVLTLTTAPAPATPPEAPPAPQPPNPEQGLKLLEVLLLRLVSPLKALPVQTAEAVVYVRPEEIAYITTTKDRHILIVDREGREWQRFDVLKKLFERLSPDPRFFLAHKSCIVNLYAVKTFRKNPETKLNELTFGDKVKGIAPVSGGNLKELRARLEL